MKNKKIFIYFVLLILVIVVFLMIFKEIKQVKIVSYLQESNIMHFKMMTIRHNCDETLNFIYISKCNQANSRINKYMETPEYIMYRDSRMFKEHALFLRREDFLHNTNNFIFAKQYMSDKNDNTFNVLAPTFMIGIHQIFDDVENNSYIY